VQFNTAKQRRVTMMAILHFTTLVMTTLFAAGAAALVNWLLLRDISAYASGHCGQGIDGCSDETFGGACPRVQVILEWLTRLAISAPPYHERIEFPFA
jgi:hypothetical protein